MIITNELMKLVCEKLGPFLEGEAAERYREQGFLPYCTESLYALTTAYGKKIVDTYLKHPKLQGSPLFETKERSEQAFDILQKACSGYPVGPEPYLFTLLRNTVYGYIITGSDHNREITLDIPDYDLLQIFKHLDQVIPLPELIAVFQGASNPREEQKTAGALQDSMSPDVITSFSFNARGTRDITAQEDVRLSISLELDEDSGNALEELRETEPVSWRRVAANIDDEIFDLAWDSMRETPRSGGRFPVEFDLEGITLTGDMYIEIEEAEIQWDSQDVASCITITDSVPV